ncbi:MAG: histidinol dehydrogenase [Deltaproteobacteria bacterium]|nr:histidinol dehydrogenase [Deltaproteobacteria bacterium]
MVRILKSTDKNFQKNFQKIIRRGEGLADGIEDRVREILLQVRQKGDRSLLELTRKFDQNLLTLKTLEVTPQEMKKAYSQVSKKDLSALQLAATRIRHFHQKLKLPSWEKNEGGVRLGQRVTPLQRVGIYVPGGKAAYPSSVLMNAIPARVAGVEEVVMVTPFPQGVANPHVLVAADLAKVDRIFKVGGAQAVAALAYGTASIPKVDKIVGPGNIYVALAKRQVFGEVDIDMIAGPSEILVIADATANSDWVAADLLSQAEHDEKASSVLVTWSETLLEKVQSSLEKILKTLPRKKIALESLRHHGALILVRNSNEAATIANEVASEHLELAVKNPRALLPKIKNAGAIFLGHHTTESFGDYLAGPNHVLPTSGTARFASPLSTYDFLKFSSVIECSPQAAKKLGPTVAHLADLEGLQAHALSMRLRYS